MSVAAGATVNLLNSGATVSDANTALTGTIDVGNGGAFNASGVMTLSTGSVLESTGGTGSVGNTTATGSVSGLGSIFANGGTLAISENVGALTGTTGIEISSSSSSAILLTGALSSGDSIKFDGASGYLGTAGNIAVGNVITGMYVSTNSGTSTPTPATTNYIDFTNQSVTVDSGYFVQTGASATIDLSNGSVLTLSGVAGNNTGTWYVDAASDGAGGTDIFLSTQPCYAAGTRILTATGERQVELLQPGDVVLTLVGETLDAHPIKWIGRRRLDLTAHPRPHLAAPVRIRKDAFAEGMPHTDLVVSPDHAVLADGKLICARQLINGTTIRQEMDWTSVEYFHVELESHAILLAEGMPAESYLDTGNRGLFANGGAPLVLHPDLTDEADYPAREAGSCAPFVSEEAGVLPVWQRLADRAATLGQPVAQPATIDDPGLCLLAKGRTWRPLYGENGLYVFALPKGVTEVRVTSRAAAPTDTRPWLEDQRDLGVYVSRIVLRGANEVLDIPLDHPELNKGWWAVERDGTSLRRWTNGDAVLALPAFEHPAMLEIHASPSGLAYLAETKVGRRAA
jgi:hypothetical protein